MNFIAPPVPSAAWAYFLDIDGTLIELAPTPDSVRINDDLRQLIIRLHERCGGAVALVTGRALKDLDARLGLPQVPSSGQHGLEWRDASGTLRRRTGAGDISAVAGHLATLRRRYRQLLIEDKGLSLALHYRSAPRLGGYLHRWVRGVVGAASKHLDVQSGKRVIEIKPKGHDKGRAIEAFMAEAPFAGRLPVFIGDDLTDEHGFDVVNRMNGISIKVGRGPTRAQYRLKNVHEVLRWLRHAAAGMTDRQY